MRSRRGAGTGALTGPVVPESVANMDRTAEGLAKRFQGARVAQVSLLLEAMAALGLIREFQGRYAA